MEFEEFAASAAGIEAASADTEIVDLVTDLLAAAGEDLPVIARFVQGRVFPAWASTKLDVGPNLCYEALARAAGPNVSADDVESRVAEVGEIGEVAASYEFGGQQGLSAFGGGGRDGLTVAEVYDELGQLAAAEGEGSEGTKLDVLFGLFNRCDPEEARYLARLVLSEMRIGVGGGTVRDAVAAAFDVPVETVERALQVSNDYGEVARTARDDGEAGLDAMELELGRPVRAMLAQTGTVTEALEEWGEVACEVKYDGARVQVHYDPDGLAVRESAAGVADDGAGARDVEPPSVGVYSRNMEDVTDALPEVVEFVEDNCEGPAILDGEVVAVRDGEPLPFQEVLRRFRRKHDIQRAREEVAVQLHAFDCLHAGGEDLLDAPLVERREQLEAVLPEATSEFVVSDDAEDVETIETDALEAGHEGIMLKNPDAAYTPGRRGKNWLKRKPDVETLDLVVTGAEWGEGRRAQFLGTFLLSARADGVPESADSGASETSSRAGFETIGKVATGITDEQLAELTELIEPHVVAEDGKDVEVEPAVVFEVGYEEIQASPTYSSGYALRFPRFVAVRDDKEPEDADTIERVERLADGR